MSARGQKSFQVQAEEYKARLEKLLYEKNAFTDVLAQIEAKTKVKRIYMVLSALALTAIWLIFGYAADLLCNLIGFIYPAYKSVKAIESVEKDDDTQWLVYWVVYAFFMLVEFFSDIFLSWFPMYFFIKCMFLLWCMAPFGYNGANVVYHRIIKPFVLKHENEIDRTLKDIKKQAKSAVDDVSKVAGDAAAEMAADQIRQNVSSSSGDGGFEDDKKDL